MVKILGQLEEYFNNTEPDFECDFAICEYKNTHYEIWNVSKSVFDKLDNYEEEEWSEKFPNSWWRHTISSFKEGDNVEKKYTLEIIVSIDENELFPGQTIEEFFLDQLKNAPLQVDEITIK